MPTPSLNPPLVTSGSVRLLLHENVLGAVFAGYKKLMPDLFVIGSYSVTKPVAPISLPKPGGGTAYVDYHFELTKFGFDIVPNDQTFDGFADPFNLSANQVALYAQIVMDFKGTHPKPWSDRVVIRAWFQCEMQPISRGIVSFSLKDVRVSIDNLTNASLTHIIDMILLDYLDTLVGQIKLNLD